MSNGVPIIGQKPQQQVPIVNVDIKAIAPHVVIKMSLLGIDHREARMDAQVAANVMSQIGMALEEIQPGMLIPALKNWIAELEQMKRQAQDVLAEMGMSR